MTSQHHFTRRTATALLGLLAFAPLCARAQTVTGGADDVPTWKAGDQWDYNRSFTLNLTISAMGLITIPIPLVFTDNHRKIVGGVEVADNGTTGTLATQAYRRDRAEPTLFNVGGSGSGSFAGTTVRLSLAVPNPTKTTGYDWVSIGDLALIRENLTTTDPLSGIAHIEAEGILAGTVCGQLEGAGEGIMCQTKSAFGGEPTEAGDNPFTLDFTLNLDHGAPTDGQGGGLEYLDFPAQAVSEAWTQSLTRNISGIFDLNISNGGLAFNDSFAAGLSGGFEAADPLTVVSLSAASPAPNSFAGSIQVEGRFDTAGSATDDIIYYNAGAKESVYWRIGDITNLVTVEDEDFSVTGDLLNFITRVSAVAVDGSSAITNVSYEPGASTAPLVSQGVPVCVSGTAPAGATVTAEVIQPGGGGSAATTIAGGDGSFSMTITTPATNDDSPMVAGSPNFDEGSFGVAFTLNADPIPAKVATIRLTSVQAVPPLCDDGPGCPTGGRSLGDFDCTGCTDINDFLFLLDNWQMEVDGEIIGVGDFLALLDNWQAGPNCP